jgi:hypothetical protein
LGSIPSRIKPEKVIFVFVAHTMKEKDLRLGEELGCSPVEKPVYQ